MKKFISFLCVCASAFAFAATATVDGKTWTYDLVNGEATLVSGPQSGELVIPAVINGCPVVAIESSAFEGCKELTSLSIPETVRLIGDSAFEGCSGLTAISMPICSVGGEFGNAFFGCHAVQVLKVIDGIESHDLSSFYDSFRGCGVRPKEITLSAETATEGVSLGSREDRSELFDCVEILNLSFDFSESCSSNATISLPHLRELNFTFLYPMDGESFGEFSLKLADCPNLVSITGLDTCKAPLAVTLDNLNALLRLELPLNMYRLYCLRSSALQSVTFVDNGSSCACEGVDVSFAGCTALESVDLSGLRDVWLDVMEAPQAAFSGCKALTKVVLPADMMGLPANIFRGCTSLTEVALPETLGSISSNAFRGCTALKEIAIPANVSYLESGVFRGCTALEKIKFRGVPPCVMDEHTHPFPAGATGEYYYEYRAEWQEWLTGPGGYYDLDMSMNGRFYLTVEAEPVTGGTVSGCGEYEATDTVTLTATPAEGYVFTGWYTQMFDDCDRLSADYRYPEVSCEAQDAPAYAVFTRIEDLATEEVWLNYSDYTEDVGERWYTLGEDDEMHEPVTIYFEPKRAIDRGRIVVETGTFPTVTVTGLPEGVTFNPNLLEIAGAPLEPGSHKVTVSVTALNCQPKTGVFEFFVNNYKSEVIQVIENHGEKIDHIDGTPFVPGAEIDFPISGADGCEVSGLPPGLMWDAERGCIVGKPTNPGNYTVTFTKETELETIIFAVGEPPLLTLLCADYDEGYVEDGSQMGTLSGAGAYPAGKTVTLKAVPKPGYHFAGWHTEEGYPLGYDACDEDENLIPPQLDYRTPTYPYVTTAYDTVIYASFIETSRLAEESECCIMIENPNEQMEPGKEIIPTLVDICWPTLPTVTVTGLPPGLKFNAKNFVISGKPTTPGLYSVKVTAKDRTSGRIFAETFEFFIEHFDAHRLHAAFRQDLVLSALYDDADGLSLEEIFGGALSAVQIKTLKLPAGLIYDKAARKIRGTGKLKCGYYTAMLTDMDGKVTTFTVVVETSEIFDVVSDRTDLHKDAPMIGFVQGESADMELLRVYPHNDEEAGLKQISVTVSGLPAGLKVKLIADSHEDETSERMRPYCFLDVSGKTAAPPGEYPVDVLVKDTRTGYEVPRKVTVYVYPALTSTKIDGSWSSENVRLSNILLGEGELDTSDGQAPRGSLEIDFNCLIKGKTRTCSYDALFTDNSGNQYVKKQSMRLNEITAAENDDGSITYDYYFEGLDNDTEFIAADLLITDAGRYTESATTADLCFVYDSTVDAKKTVNAIVAMTAEVARDERFKIKPEGSFRTGRVTDVYQAGFVQGEKALIEVGEIIPYPGTRLSNFKITAVGLPKGIKVVTERDYYDDDSLSEVEGVLEVYLEGTATAEPGIYEVELIVSESGTGFTKTFRYDYTVLPKIPAAWHGTYTASASDLPIGEVFYGSYRKVDERQGTASATLTVTLSDTVRRAEFTSSCSYGAGWEYTGRPPLRQALVFRDEFNTRIGWCYDFYQETASGNEGYGSLIFWVDTDENGNPDMESAVETEMCCGLYYSGTELYIWEYDDEYRAPINAEVIRQ